MRHLELVMVEAVDVRSQQATTINHCPCNLIAHPTSRPGFPADKHADRRAVFNTLADEVLNGIGAVDLAAFPQAVVVEALDFPALGLRREFTAEAHVVDAHDVGIVKRE